VCGIAGIVAFRNGEQPALMPLVQNMCRTMKHRGPDEDAYFMNTKAAFGMTRLAIIDLRKGLYPLRNEDGTLLLFYNGEIYNFADLRSQLTLAGHKFRSGTDGEAIVHAFEEWGPECVKKFNGMWAFAIWDTKKEELFLSRDHFGIKPLYYTIRDNCFFYASEIRALLSVPGMKREPNEKAIYDYLVDGRVDHMEETFFAGIYRLMPAHYATLTHSGTLKKTSYWSIDRLPSEVETTPLAEASERVRELFVDAVRLRLTSDVPVGTCLSGGLDSSSIVATISQLKNEEKKSIGKRLQTFSACFLADPIDESSFANLVAKAANAEQNPVYPSANEFWLEIQELIRTQEEPFISSSVYAQWKIMQSVRSNHVTVLLDGQGGDEVFAGYIEYFKPYISGLLRRHKVLTGLKEAIKSLDLTFPLILLLVGTGGRFDKTNRRILNTEFAARFAARRSEHRVSNMLDSDSSLSTLLRNDIARFTLPGLLRYEDKNSMHFSIETRLPFLDPRLVEYVDSLPVHLKIEGGWTKRVFREAMEGILPKEIQWRRSKIGFVTPQESWLSELANNIGILFSAKMLSSKFVNPNAFTELLSVAKKKKLPVLQSGILWRCICLELWLREFCPDL